MTNREQRQMGAIEPREQLRYAIQPQYVRAGREDRQPVKLGLYGGIVGNRVIGHQNCLQFRPFGPANGDFLRFRCSRTFKYAALRVSKSTIIDSNWTEFQAVLLSANVP